MQKIFNNKIYYNILQNLGKQLDIFVTNYKQLKTKNPGTLKEYVTHFQKKYFKKTFLDNLH